jgi:hypothetical protein
MDSCKPPLAAPKGGWNDFSGGEEEADGTYLPKWLSRAEYKVQLLSVSRSDRFHGGLQNMAKGAG